MPAPFLRTALLLVAILLAALDFASANDDVIRVGMIGCDTSHAPRYAKMLRNSNAGDSPQVRVVAVCPTRSDDIPSSYERVERFTDDLRKQRVKVVGSIEELLPLVDAVMIESVDGRAHLEQARAAITAGKPVFIDKPVAASLADAVAIYGLAENHGVPCFSSSSLRYSPDMAAACGSSAGDILGCETSSPCTLEPHHPDLFWYGVHGVEMLFTIMGPGCERVSRTQTADGELVVGVWKDGRIGTFRGLRSGPGKYSSTIYGSKKVAAYPAMDTNYQGLVDQIREFFVTKQSPVPAAETIEIFAFMEAADESKRQGGRPVKLADVLNQARHAAR